MRQHLGRTPALQHGRAPQGEHLCTGRGSCYNSLFPAGSTAGRGSARSFVWGRNFTGRERDPVSPHAQLPRPGSCKMMRYTRPRPPETRRQGSVKPPHLRLQGGPARHTHPPQTTPACGAADSAAAPRLEGVRTWATVPIPFPEPWVFYTQAHTPLSPQQPHLARPPPHTAQNPNFCVYHKATLSWGASGRQVVEPDSTKPTEYSDTLLGKSKMTFLCLWLHQ